MRGMQQVNSSVHAPVPVRIHRSGAATEKLASWFALVLLTSTPVLANTLATDDARAIDLAIKSIRAESTTPFVSVAITTAANLCHSGQYGDPKQQSPDSAPPKFHAASISKVMTATVIMQLQGEGKLSIDDPVSKYEPMFASSPIKLVDLLTHTSGLRDRVLPDARHERQQIDSYIASLAEQKLVDPPGKRWEYSDAGYNLLGRVVERITGRPFADAMRERILAPLGMHHSDFDLARIPADNRLTAFDKEGKQLPHPWDIAFLPSSGLQTTAEDLSKFARAILAIGTRSNVRTPIDAQVLREMTRVRTATAWNGIGQGLGWQIASSEIGPQWRHAGGQRGFESLLTLYPDKGFAIVVLGNRADWPRFQLEEKLRKLVTGTSMDCSRNGAGPAKRDNSENASDI